MSERIVQLASGGMTPALKSTSEALGRDLWVAIDKATDAGIPAGLIVGHLEFVKAAIIHQSFEGVEPQ